ncbi:MAG: hypothetical protein A2Y53_05660 [Chloroflexi bacterium RBG_16_47_49]|nr:MAG: hypothetical protein A2Y53_05660 [Chloroflexi bacterium RBG_16_47_49]
MEQKKKNAKTAEVLVEQDEKSIFDLYERDMDAEEDGQWVLLSKGNIEVKIRSLSSKTCVKVIRRLKEKYLKLNRNVDNLPESQQFLYFGEIAAYGLVVDWKNVRGKNRQPLKFSTEAAYKIFTNPSMVNFAMEICEAAGHKETFLKHWDEESEKNLLETSIG